MEHRRHGSKTQTALLLAALCAAAAPTPSHGGTQLKKAPAAAAGDQGGLHTPKAGSPERKALFEALRPAIERDLEQKVVFKVDHLAVQNGWAFYYGEPQQPGGKPIDYRRGRYRDRLEQGALDAQMAALLRQQKGKWRVIQYAVGPTDVAWADWDKQFGAPPAIFKMK